MTDLKAEGFAAVVAGAADRVRQCGTIAEALRAAYTLDGRVPADLGRAALSLAEQAFLDAAECCGAVLDPLGRHDERLVLAGTGRLRVVPPGSEPGPQDHVLGSVTWPVAMPSVRRMWRLADDVQTGQYEALARLVADEPAATVRDWLDNIGYALVHMAPVLLYVGTKTYSNLGQFSNLPGKSLRLDAPGALLTELAAVPVTQWSAEDATFVACLTALLRSGPAVRAEEFNGVQLVPDTVEAFLCERIRSYGGDKPDLSGLHRLARLDALAARCSQLRKNLIAGGVEFYRTINGINLHKREQIFDEPITYADVPTGVQEFLAGVGGAPEDVITDFAGAESAIASIVDGFAAAPVPEKFSSAFEAFLHELMTVVAEATGSDVSMGRGPRQLAVLAEGAAPTEEQLKLGTKEFYCCVTPSKAFADRFGGNTTNLVKALSAYSSRMRYNTWHYWLDSFGLGDHKPGGDWFFAPTMPDIADWSDQHHTGHIVFGVRYAIRVPVGITFDGAYRPGLYDLRLMRTGAPRFEVTDLRSGIAVGHLLACLHQLMAENPGIVSDFGNEWYRSFHG